MVIAITPSTSSVAAALRPCGRRNALTPFAIASTPVSAVEPDENARSTTKSETVPYARRERMRCDGMRAGARRAFPDSHRDRDQDRSDEPVRRQREEDPRFANAAQVRRGDQGDADERERQLVRAERSDCGREREHTCGDRYGDGQDIVGEESGCRDEARNASEILLRDDVGPTRALVDLDGLPVRQEDRGEQRGDREPDREHEMCRAGRRGHEDDECGLGRVGDRRQRVRCKDRKGEPLRKKGLIHLVRRHRTPDQIALDPGHDPGG